MKRAVMGLLIVLLVLSAGGFAMLSAGRGDGRVQVAGPLDRSLPPARSPGTAGRSPASTTRPTDPPGRHATTPHAREMSPEFRVLLDRSIFARPALAAERSAKTRPAATAAETTLVLRGITEQVGGDVMALVEDLGSGRIHRVHVGEAIGSGRFTRVTLDGVMYERAGRPTLVTIGHDLSGALVPSPVAPAAVTASAHMKGDGSGEPGPKKKQKGGESDREREAREAKESREKRDGHDATAATRSQGDHEE